MLHRAVENIVRNALRHTPEHSTIEVDGGARGAAGAHHGARCRPRCAGPRAWAKSSSLSCACRALRSDGHGLGLAIARRVVESAGGSISARNRAEGGLAVEIVLPLAGDDTPLA